MATFNQSYGYDTVNRLQTASDSGGWSRSYGYDPYGNMWVTGYSGIGLSPATPTSNIYSAANNRKTNESYDNAGNQTSMGGIYSFSYDAENRQVAESNTLGNPAAQYIYDGAGQRVEKVVGGTTTVYVYDALGQLTADYTNAAVGTPPCQTCYLIQDHLGSTRLVTDQNANVVAFHDYLPFGEEVPGNSVGRGSLFGAFDQVNQKFTGQYRDTETGNDFFNARYYAGAMGRFTSPDPGNAGADPTNPQTWNAYAYVLNGPLTRVDPTGLADTTPTFQATGTCGIECLLSGVPFDTWAWWWNGGWRTLASPNFGGSSGGSGGGGGGTPPTQQSNAQQPPKNCTSALRVAGQTPAALQRAIASWPILSSASAANNINTRLLAAIGVRETGFQNLTEADGAGVGVGVFQITVSPTSGVTAAQASNLPWAANHAANLLSSNGSYLSRRFPSFTPGQLLQATAASYNMNPYKPGNFTGIPNTIDIGTAHNNYGSNVVSLMSCFGN